MTGDGGKDVGLRSIIVGAGLMGRHHARAAAAAGASIVGIVDRDAQAAKALAGEWPGAVARTDAMEMLISVPADVAHICTPAASHVGIGEAAAKAVLHALIEKPIGVAAAEAKRIHEEFDRARKMVCPVHQYAFQRSVRSAAAALPSMGALRRIEFDICSAGGANGRMALDEVVAEILPHPLAMTQRLLPSLDVAELDWSCKRATEGEWLVSAPIAGGILTMSLSMNGRPTRFLTRITADGGSIELDNFHDFATVLPGKVSKAQKIASPFVRNGRHFGAAAANLVARAARCEFAYPGLRTLVREFYAAASRPGAPAPITPEQSIAAAVARDRIIGLASRA